jgi:hypothetical protein
VTDVWVGESRDVRSMVAGKETPIDDRNERSLPYWFEIRRLDYRCVRKVCVLFRDGPVKRSTYGVTLLTSFSKASKRGALSSGMADLFMEPGLLNTLGATFFSELQATYEPQEPSD